jgi:hypothetical protein
MKLSMSSTPLTLLLLVFSVTFYRCFQFFLESQKSPQFLSLTLCSCLPREEQFPSCNYIYMLELKIPFSFPLNLDVRA